MDQLDTMKVFTQVAELASFTRAAENLGIPKASVSSAIQQLETQLGTRLLHRTTRRVRLTPDGEIYFERCKDVLADVDELELMFAGGTVGMSGRIRVDMPLAIARNLIIPRLPEFLKMYPGIEVELSSTDRYVDLVREGFDCVIRVGTLSDSGLVARQVGQFTMVNCVSRAYAKQFGRPQKLNDLAKHRVIHYTSVLGTKPYGFEYFDGEKTHNIKMPVAITVNNSDAYLASCLAGLGIIQAPQVRMKQYIKRGELVEVLPKYRAEPLPIALVYPHRRNLGRRVRAFMEWVEKEMKAYLA
jgi:DNA-binding transcriptional LysR family regulator